MKKAGTTPIGLLGRKVIYFSKVGIYQNIEFLTTKGHQAG
jgi:hypothetical protein